MGKIFRYLRIKDPQMNPRRYRVIFHVCVAFLCMWALQACYSSTAVKGIPVRDLVMAEDQRVVKELPGKAGADNLSGMNQVESNKVFKEISGIPEYRIGPLDVLEISSHIGDKVTTTSMTVDSRGKISYSFIDDLEVAGLSPSQLDRLISQRLSSFIKHPRIDVLVKEFRSKSATVLGELASLRASTSGTAASGRIYMKGKTTLMDLIAMAGGYTIDADIKKVKLIRQGRTYLINLYDILEKGDASRNVIIDDGDVVDIQALPEFGERVYVMGEVKSQGIYSLKDARDILGAISLAGNVTTLAKEDNTLIVRGYGHGEPPLVMMADLYALFNRADLAQNIDLQDGDLVYVPRMLIGDINDWITNTMPLLDFLFYPKRFQGSYFTRDYLHINPR